MASWQGIDMEDLLYSVYLIHMHDSLHKDGRQDQDGNDAGSDIVDQI